MVVCLLIVDYTGGSINTMVLGGLALVFSRLIDNGVIVLENIFRHMEMGKSPWEASAEGGTEVSMAVLADTFTTSIVFFPVTFFTGVSKYIFTPMALGVVLSIFRFVFLCGDRGAALFCAKFISLRDDEEKYIPKMHSAGSLAGLREISTPDSSKCSTGMKASHCARWNGPGLLPPVIFGGIVVLLVITVPFIGRAYFPRTDPGQFIIDVRMPSGTRQK